MNTNIENTDMKENKITSTVGKWIGWIGLIVSIIGFFWMRIWFGLAGVILGAIGLFSPEKKLSTITIIAGVLAIILGIIL